MSMQQPGMSMQQPGMSMQQPGMSMQQPGMSMDIPAQQLPTSSPTIMTTTDNAPPPSAGTNETSRSVVNATSSVCVSPDLTTSPTVDITIQLEVETMSGGTIFVEDLVSGLVSSLSTSFSLCLPTGNRFLLVRVPTTVADGRRLEEPSSKVVGLEVNDKTEIASGMSSQTQHDLLDSRASNSHCISHF